MHSIMASLNSGQDVANKWEIKYAGGHVVAKSYSLSQAAGMRRCGSLININPSVASQPSFGKTQP